MQGKLLENLNIASAFAPVDMSSGANAGDWIDVSQYQEFAVVVFKGVGTAGDDPTVTIEQGTSNAGAGNKALNFTEVYYKQNTALTSEGVWSKATQSAGNTYTDATSAEDQAIWVIPFKTSALDADNDFTHVQASVADVGTNAQLGCAFIILGEPRVAEAPEDQATVLG